MKKKFYATVTTAIGYAAKLINETGKLDYYGFCKEMNEHFDHLQRGLTVFMLPNVQREYLMNEITEERKRLYDATINQQMMALAASVDDQLTDLALEKCAEIEQAAARAKLTTLPDDFDELKLKALADKWDKSVANVKAVPTYELVRLS